LHLSLLPNPPPAEPYYHLLETQGNTQTATQRPSIPSAKKAQIPSDGTNTSQEQDELRDSSSSDSSGDDEENEDAEMAELLRENSASDSSDEDGVIEPGKKLSETTRRVRKKSLNQYDSPASNVAVLMLACWTMRIPVMCADFRKLVVHPTCPN
jgi:RNA polymerase I-specific transcription initiation factor RRN7